MYSVPVILTLYVKWRQDMMNAIVHERFGSPDVLELRSIPKPEPDAGQVLVQVRAAAVNPADWYELHGRPYVAHYTREGSTRSGGPYGLAIDIAGSRPFSAYRRLLAEGATAVIVGGSKRNRWLGPLGNVIRARVASIGKSQRVVFFVADVNR